MVYTSLEMLLTYVRTRHGTKYYLKWKAGIKLVMLLLLYVLGTKVSFVISTVPTNYRHLRQRAGVLNAVITSSDAGIPANLW